MSDAYLDEHAVSIPNESEYTEHYHFTFDRYELEENNAYLKKYGLQRITVMMIAMVIGAVFCMIFLESQATTTALTIFAALLLGIRIRLVQTFNKRAQCDIPVIMQKAYDYTVCKTGLMIKVYQCGELRRTQKIDWQEIERIQETPKHLLLLVAGQHWVFRKADLNEDSLLWEHVKGNRQRFVPLFDKWTTLSHLLVAASFLSIMVSYMIAYTLNIRTDSPFSQAGCYFLFTLIPIASIATAIRQKKHGADFRLLLAVSIVTLAVLVVCGLTSVFFGTING